MSQERVYFDVGADNFLQVGGNEEDVLMNVLTDETPEDATVIVTIKNRAGTVVAGVEDFPMDHVVGTTGELTAYRAIIDDTIEMPVGDYTAIVTAEKSGVKGVKYVPITVRRG